MPKVADNSFLLFVYPFLFSAAEFGERANRIDLASLDLGQERESKTARVWEPVDFPRDDMLAYVADYLNPRAAPAPDASAAGFNATNSDVSDKLATARLWRLTDDMQSVYGLDDWASWLLLVANARDSVELSDEAVKDPYRLAEKLKAGHDPCSTFLREQLTPGTRRLLELYDPANPRIQPLLAPLLEDLNVLVNGPWIYEEKRFAHLDPADQLKLAPKAESRAAANRRLLQLIYPLELVEPHIREIPFCFGKLAKGSKKQFSVQLALFGVGVGFLTLRVTPKSAELDDWLTFLSVFRYVRGQRANGVRAQKRRFDRATNSVHEMPFFPEPAGRVGSSRGADGSGHLTEIIDALLLTAAIDQDNGEWWREVFIPEQTLPFAVMFVDEIQVNQIPPLIFRLRNYFTPTQGLNPAPEDLNLSDSSLMTYAENQWFIYSLDGGAFLACDAPKETQRERDFFGHTLPNHLRDQYFILFLLVLQQRFLLMSVSQQVAEIWPQMKFNPSVEDFDRIRGMLLEFAARGMFTQIMQREHHHRCYRKWQEIFQLKELYREVRDEVREMHEFLRAAKTEEILSVTKRREEIESRIEKRIKFVGLVFGVPALVIGFLNINIVGATTRDEGLLLWTALKICIGSALVGGLISLLIGLVKWNTGIANSKPK